jgi:hypothetical protein
MVSAEVLINDISDKMVSLAEYNALETRYNQLLDEHNALRSSTVIEKVDFAPTFDTLRTRVADMIGVAKGAEKGWQKAFLDGFGGKYTNGHLSKWRNANRVPQEVLDEIPSMDLTKIVERKCSGKRWTEEETNIMRGFTVKEDSGYIRVVDEHTIESLAAELSSQFGRSISEGSVKSKLNTFRDGHTRKNMD